MKKCSPKQQPTIMPFYTTTPPSRQKQSSGKRLFEKSQGRLWDSHTPAPWEFRVYSEGCTIVSKHNAPGRTVRDWLKGVSVQVGTQIDDDQSNVCEASPDARLMRGAAEMYEALRDIANAKFIEQAQGIALKMIAHL